MHATHTAVTAAGRCPRALPPRAPLALALAAALTLSAPAAAQVASTQLPTGGSIAGGTGTIQAPAGATQVITQTSNRMALTWSSFDVGSAATVRFDQPSTSAAVLNLIGGSAPSQIFGNLSSNGQVFLINSRGVLFGNTAQVNVGGLVASSLGTSAANFMNSTDALDAGGSTAPVINSGTITAAAGSVNLIGGQVVNNGTITATAGNITLAGADRATLTFESGGFGVIITRALQSQLATLAVQNTGSLIAPGGTISLQARAASGVFSELINNSGIISAASLSDAGSDGNVSLIANGATGTSIGGSGSIDVDTGSISYSTEGSVQQTGVLTAARLDATTGNDLLLTGSNQMDTIGATVGRNLSVTNARDLAQTNALDVDGTSTFALAANTLTLDNAGNDFTGAVTITAGATSINDGNALMLGTLSTGNLTATSNGALNLGSGSVTGTLAATSNNGAISQSTVSGLTVTGTSNLQAGTGGITLATGSNDFQQAVTLTGGTTSITDSNALTLGTLSTGNLTATSTGDLNLGTGTVGGVLTAISNGGTITQADVLNVTGTGTINAGGGAIALGNNGNDFTGALSLTGGSINVHDRNDLSITALTNGPNGAVELFSNATLSLSPFAIDTGTALLYLASNGGALSTAGNLRGGTVSLRARDGVAIGHDIDATSLNLTTGNAAVNQSAGSVVVATTTTANTDGGALALTGAGNNFSGVLNLSAGNVQLNDVDGISLGTLNTGALTVNSNGALNLGRGTINGALTANSGGGAITQTNPLTVTGASTLNAGSGTITLDNAGNDFQAAVGLTGNGITLRDANALTVGALTTTGTAAVQVLAGGALTLPAQAIDTGTGDLSLTSLGGALTTAGTLAGNNVALRASGALNLAHAIQARGTLGLTSDTAAITQTAGLLDVTGATTASAAAGVGAITLNGTNNDFQGALSLTGGTVLINDRNALDLGSLDTSTLTVASHGNLDLGQGTIGGRLTASSNGGTIGQSGALTLTGAATLDAGSGAIALSNSDNDFQDALALTGTGISVHDRNALRIGALSAAAGGDVALTAGGGLSLPAQAIDIGSGNLSLTAEGGLLGTSGALSANQIRLRGGSGLNLAHDITAADSLTLTTNNTAITQTAGAVTAGALATVDAGTGAIALAGSGNDFVAQLALTGSGIAVYDSNDLSIASLSSGSNSPVTLTAGRALSLPMQAIDTGSADLRLSSESGTLLTNGVLSGRNVSLDAGAGMVLRHDVNASGNLRLTTDDASIAQQSGRADVDGTTEIIAGSGDVSLTSPSNVFSDTVSVSGDQVQIDALGALRFGSFATTTLAARSGGALNLGQGSTTGTLIARSGSGGITQTGAVTAGGASTMDAGSSAITLNDANNDFQGAVGVTGNGITVTDRNTLSVSSITGNSNGDIALTAQALDLPASAISAGTGTLSLTATGSALSTGGNLSGSNVVLDARDGLTLAHDITTGNLTLRTTNTAINQTAGQLTVGGLTDANAGTANIALTGNNDFQNAVTLTGGAIQLNDPNALTLGTLNTGALTVTSNGALNLGQGTVDGALNANSTNGAITQAGALNITGTSTLNAGSGAITLDSTNNDFAGALTLTAGTARIVDANALTLDQVAVGALDVRSSGLLNLGAGNAGSLSAASNGGAIGQAGALVIAGDSVIDAGAGAVTLNESGNDFGGGLAVTAGTVQLRDVNALSLATSRVDAIAAVAGGDITQTGVLSASGNASFDAGVGAIALVAPGNDFGGPVSLRGGAVGIADTNALTLGRLDVTTLDATSHGDLNLGFGVIAGTLSGSSDGGAIRQGGSLRVLGDAALNAGSGTITLGAPSIELAGKVDLSAAVAQIDSAASLTLGVLDVGELNVWSLDALNLGQGRIGTLTARSALGAISQTGPLEVSGSSRIASSANDVRLDNVNNDFVGALSVFGKDVTLIDRNALMLGQVDAQQLTVTSTGPLNLGWGWVSGALRATSNGGAIDQIVAIGVGGASVIDAGTGTITLADRFNDFIGGVSLFGGASRIADNNALTLDTFAVTSLSATSNATPLDWATRETLTFGSGRVDGALTAISSGGAIVQRGALSVGGVTTLDAASTNSFVATAGSITLTGNNAFAGAVSLTGGATQLNAGSALTVGAVNTGALTVTSNGALNLGQGTVDGALIANSASGAITQAGALNVSGTSTLNAGSSAITLNDADNDFSGAVTAAGSGIVLVDRNDLQVASVQSGGNASVSLDAGGALQLPASAIDVGTGALSLIARGGTLTTTHALRGGDVQLSGANGITLGEGISASGTLRLRSTNAAITQNAGTLQVAGNSVVDAGSGAITLDAAGNDFQGLLALTGGAMRVRDANALTLDALDTGALNVASNGALNLGFGLVDGDLDAASNGGAVTQTAALTVTGATRINSAGATIALADAGNDFQSALSLSGGDTRVRDRNGLTLGTLDVGALDVASGAGLNLGQGRIGGTLVARSGSNGIGSTGRLTAQAVVRPAATGADITQQGALTIVVNSVLDAGTGAIVLTDAGNDFQGSVQASGGSIALADRNDLAATAQSSGAVNLQAGGQLSSSSAISGSNVTLGSGGAMQLAHDITSAGTLTLRSGGAINQRAGSLRAAQLSGSAAGVATLTGAGNAIGTLGDFSARGLDVFSATTLQVSGRVDGGSLLRLGSGGALLLDGQLNGASTWLQAVAGIGQRAGSTLTANLLSGNAAGPVVLGDAGSFIDNRVVRLGNFTASNGFSLTNAGDLTLVLSDGSSYSVDAGNSALFLSVRGDLVQDGRATLRDGIGSFSATGRIGTQDNPLYVIGTGTQTIGLVGAPPAYFNATTADGGLLDLGGGSSFNVPASAFAGRAQSSASRTIAFIDLSASGTPYRAFGLVRPGLRLPDDQQPACDAGDPDAVCTPQ
ncbi:beta strand repeat-containing protein [Xanthomonas campestris]|uniref:beta strand repeat-containing protein n=1 Tax=Xanthomonas campestris TaxID=339 RepID=UPI001E614E6A|nr:filamentous hemagglutinin N-terminal domain-containing protein [Xanthomonas campestris]MCC4603508.1 filamentous hemagglutinin N-terminal domain-containing protein [Xanthomonas campestris pv. parthenii]